jgi:hypothetical protein
MAARAKVHFPRVQPSEASGSVGQMTNQPFDHLVGAASEPLPRPPGDAEGAPLAGKPLRQNRLKGDKRNPAGGSNQQFNGDCPSYCRSHQAIENAQ